MAKILFYLALSIGIACAAWITAGPLRNLYSGYPREVATWPSDGSPSVLQFGFDGFHSGSTRSAFASGAYQPKQAYYPRELQGAGPRTPLYINGYADRHSPFTDKHVLIYGTRFGREVRAWDIEADRILWSIEDLPGNVAGTPLIDLERGRIYFTTVRWQQHENAHPDLADLITPHWVHSVDLSGKQLKTAWIDFAQLLKHEYTDTSVDPLSAMQCKTSVGINRNVDPPYIFFGCARSTARYGIAKGIRGVVARVFLEANGDIDPSAMDSFTPTIPTEQPFTGHDAGIWNSGSGPVALDDGSILVATGNGPYSPERHNYGCSVLRLDGDGFSIAPAGASGFSYYSNSDGTFNECWGSNMDMASSSVAVLKTGSRYYATITGKDGRLRVFDPYRMPGDRSTDKHEIAFARSAWGQPAIWKDEQGVVRIAAIGTDPADNADEDFVAGTPATISRLPGRYDEIECLGFVPEQSSEHTTGLAVYWSGPRRNDYVAVASNGGSIADKVFARDFTPYKHQFESGYIYRSGRGEAPAGYAFEPLWLYSGLSFAHESPGAVTPFSATQKVFDTRFDASHAERVEAVGYVLVDAADGGCGHSEPQFHSRLSLYRRAARDASAAIYASFTVERDYSLDTSWSRTLPAGMQLDHSSPAMIQDAQGSNPPLMLFTAREDAKQGQQSYLFVVDTRSGDIVDQVPFKGASSFTMPLVAGRQIVLSTTNDGIALIANRLPGEQE